MRSTAEDCIKRPIDAIIRETKSNTIETALMSGARIRISIFLRFKNEASFLPEVLRTASQQTIANAQVRLIGDGSADGSYLALVETAAHARNRLKIIAGQHDGRDPDGRHYFVAFDEIERLGYRTRQSLDTGLDETVEWIRSVAAREHAS